MALTIRTNTPVTGFYFGVPFTGIVTAERTNTRTRNTEYSVALDAPIVVLGDERTNIIASVPADTHSVYAHGVTTSISPAVGYTIG